MFAQCSLLGSPFPYDLDGHQLTSWFLASGGTSSYSPWPVGGARLDKPGINAAPVSRLLTRPGLILPALCRAFLSLAPRLSLGAGLADRIGHASQLILTLEPPSTSCLRGSPEKSEFFTRPLFLQAGRCQYRHARLCAFDPATKTSPLPSRKFNFYSQYVFILFWLQCTMNPKAPRHH